MHFMWADLERQKLLLDNYAHKSNSVLVSHSSLSTLSLSQVQLKLVEKLWH